MELFLIPRTVTTPTIAPRSARRSKPGNSVPLSSMPTSFQFKTKCPGLIAVLDKQETIMFLMRDPVFDTPTEKGWGVRPLNCKVYLARLKPGAPIQLTKFGAYPALKQWIIDNFQPINQGY